MAIRKVKGVLRNVKIGQGREVIKAKGVLRKGKRTLKKVTTQRKAAQPWRFVSAPNFDRQVDKLYDSNTFKPSMGKKTTASQDRRYDAAQKEMSKRGIFRKPTKGWTNQDHKSYYKRLKKVF